MSDKDILTVDEVAEYLRVDESTVRYMIRRGDLPVIKVGRIYRVRRVDLESLASRQTDPAQEK